MKLIFKCVAVAVIACHSALSGAQRVDTIAKAIATENTYCSLPFYGIASNGHIWGAGLVNHYANDNKAQPLEMLRIDLTEGTVTSKIIDETVSNASIYWSYTFDSLGNFYLGLNSANRKIYKFNLKDSIRYENIGSGFQSEGPLAYSLTLGLDNHIYFGASSGGTYWSEYDPYSGKLIKHDKIDPGNDYVLNIMGDSSWVYAEVGQRNSTDMWAIRKADDYKIKLFSIPNTIRFNAELHKDGVSVSFGTDTLSGNFLLKNGKAIPGHSNAPLVQYNEINNNKLSYSIIQHFDKTSSDLFYSINGMPFDKVHINSSNIRSNIKFIFFDSKDSTGFGYVGDYYGNWYWYSYKTDSAYLLGNTGFNVYSGVQYNDSIYYFGNYPSGALLKWNKNREWTTGKLINGSVIKATDPSANPKVEGYFKSETPAGFHHALTMNVDTHSNIVCAGDVIRIRNTCSIGAYNVSKDSLYGYDYHKIDRLLLISVARYGEVYVISTSNSNGGLAKLYFYEPRTNMMLDSINLGFVSYGKIYISGDTLTGVADKLLYKVDLKTHTLLQQYTLSEPVIYSALLLDGRIAINTTATLPGNFANFVKIPYTACYESNNYLYAITNGNTIIRTSVRNLGKIDKIQDQRPISSSEARLKIYPNPVSSSLHVSFEKLILKLQPYQLIDVKGAIVKTGIIMPGNKDFIIDTRNLRSGMYWLACDNNAVPFIKL